MTTTLFTNIGRLWQCGRPEGRSLRGKEMKELPFQDNAWLWVEGERIRAFGAMSEVPEVAGGIVDLGGQWLFPSWVDSHTHLVFAASREGEFVDRINGLSYTEIAAKGGGILNSARRLQEMSEDDLLAAARRRLQEVQQMGTGAIEIKSGYGLSVEAELKMLRVVRRLREESSIGIRATFLGAHALPLAYKNNRKDYVDLVVDTMLPQVAAENLADYIDVFCEKGFFTVDETIRIIEAGAKHGLKAKIHLNQFNSLGAVKACVERGAISVDHLEVFSAEDITALQAGSTIATLLPSAPFFLNDHYPSARRLLDADIPVALATDYNPGSTPSGRMSFVLSLACIKCGMLPEEAINAATMNGAAALEWTTDYGSIDQGKYASFFTTQPMSSVAFIPYAFGSDLVQQVYLKGAQMSEGMG